MTNTLFAVSALLFVASAALTTDLCASMSAMGMPMPGGWTMSMAWMRMPGQTWPDAAASFVGMWIVMMVAMMLPSFVPMLRDYLVAVRGAGGWRPASQTVIVSMGYLSVWTALGIIAFPIGAVLASIEMQRPVLSQIVPTAVGVIVLAAGGLQLTTWKTRRLASCRERRDCEMSPAAAASEALRHGVRLGLNCSQCCGNLMVILLVTGVMDLRVMAAVTAAITVERLAPAGERIARAMGAAIIVVGALLIARANVSP